jgi:hypothetical protein
MKLLGYDRPDWLLIDALEIYKEKTEYKMRSHQNLRPYEKISQDGWAVWHQRTNFMDAIDIYAKQLAKKGIIYTSYIAFKEVKTTTGTITLVAPKWAGNTMTRTRIVVKVEGKKSTDGKEFFAIVESSKEASVPTASDKLVGTTDNKGNFKIFGFKALLAEGKTLS